MTYFCGGGYRLSSKELTTTTCQADGTWSNHNKTPRCTGEGEAEREGETERGRGGEREGGGKKRERERERERERNRVRRGHRTELIT